MELCGLTFNWVDAVVGSTIFLSFLLGLLTGLVLQLASILSVFAGMALAYFGGPFVAEALGRWIDNEMVRGFIAYALCFALGSIIIRIIAAFFSVAIKKLKLEKYDRLFGGVVGAVKGAVICTVALVIAGSFQVSGIAEPVQASVCAKPILKVADAAKQWIDDNRVTERVTDAAARAAEKAKSMREDAPETLEKLSETVESVRESVPSTTEQP